MQHHYKTVYKITVHHHTNKKDGETPISFTLDEMFHLFDTTLGGCDGWSSKDNSNKSLVIQPSKWGNICLMGNPRNETLQEWIGAGAELLEKSHIYDDTIDAGIQMAYISAKADMETKHIEEATGGLVTIQGYIKLQEIFYEDFPHKFI